MFGKLFRQLTEENPDLFSGVLVNRMAFFAFTRLIGIIHADLVAFRSVIETFFNYCSGD